MKITLLGKVPKGDQRREGFVDWKREYMERISAAIPEARFLHGDLIRDDVGPEMVVGHDLWVIQHADLIVVDAREKIGAGTAQEMFFAKLKGKPVVSIIPRESHHRKSNLVFDGVMVADWVHPFLWVSSDYIADDLDGAINWIRQWTSGDTAVTIKTGKVFEESIQHFEKKFSELVATYLKECV